MSKRSFLAFAAVALAGAPTAFAGAQEMPRRVPDVAGQTPPLPVPAGHDRGGWSAPEAPRPVSAATDSAIPTPGVASTLREADARVAAVAYRLALAGRPLCAQSYPLTGMLLHHLAEYAPEQRQLILDRTPVDRGPGVLTVLERSPAARAGLAAGDVLLAVNDRPFPSPAAIAAETDRKKWRARVDATETQLEAELRKGPAQLTLLRGGRQLSLTLDSLPACLGRIRLARSTQVNAFATGRTVIMTVAMLNFLKSEDELAVVLGHELAHNILGHPATRTEEGILASFGIKASAIWRREEAADRFGLRLMGQAGYNLDAAIPFWRRYLKKYDWFPQIFRSHPSLGAREKIAADEIAAIRRAATAIKPSS